MKDYKDLKVTPELIKEMEECTAAEELVALAKANSIEISMDEAEEILTFSNRELNDNELEEVAGGKCLDDCPDRCTKIKKG